MTPTRAEHVEALRTVRRYVPETGDEISDTVESEDDGGNPLTAIRCRHGHHIYDLLAARDPSTAYFTIRYPYDALGLFARRLALEDRDAPVPEGAELEVDVEAAEAELDRLASEYPEEYAALFDRLRSTLASPHTSYSIVTTDRGAVSRFYVDRKLFVYEDGFGISDLGYGVQMVVSTGLQGRTLMEDAYDLSESVRGAIDGKKTGAAETDSIRYIG